jgi:hypothetical protein
MGQTLSAKIGNIPHEAVTSQGIFLVLKDGWRVRLQISADCLENVGSSTSHNPMGLHDVTVIVLLLPVTYSFYGRGLSPATSFLFFSVQSFLCTSFKQK